MLKQVGDSMIWEVLGNSRCCEEADLLWAVFFYTLRPDLIALFSLSGRMQSVFETFKRELLCFMRLVSLAALRSVWCYVSLF